MWQVPNNEKLQAECKTPHMQVSQRMFGLGNVL